MNPVASVANVLWLVRGRRSVRQFDAALRGPREAQWHWLRRQIARDAPTEYGRTFDFGAIRSVEQFQKRVPVVSAPDVAPWIDRIQRGERHVLTRDPVTHLVPTSGTTGARKLIPFSRSLQQGFDAAVAAWLTDLARLRPRLLWGPAYWSVTPLSAGCVETSTPAAAAVPIGFADDADYLGGAAAWLVRRVLVAPSSLRHERDLETFWRRTLVAVLAHRDLRMLSIWHPSFLDLMVAAARRQWDLILDSLHATRARELRRIGCDAWRQWWPHLQVVSCWGDQAAAPGFHALAAQAPQVLVQAKGLLATEAVVTIPYHGAHVLALTSHFFEFIDESGDVWTAETIVPGKRYEVAVTNGGGLWRYRLGDVVECTHHVASAPVLRFLGRAGQQSDLRGEKLAEPFVAEVLRALWPATPPAYVALQACDTSEGAGYDLLVARHDLARVSSNLGEQLDAALHANPHYAVARRLGQLRAPRVVAVHSEQAARAVVAGAGRLGDAKPRLLIERVVGSEEVR